MAAVSPYQPSALALTNTTSIINNVDTDSRTPLLRLVFAQVIYKLYIDSQKAQDLADGDKKSLIRPFDLVEFWALRPDSSKGRIVSEGVAVIMQGFPIIQAANDATAALLADEANSRGGVSLGTIIAAGTGTERGVGLEKESPTVDNSIRVTVDICIQLWKDVLNIDEMSTAANPELSASSHARFKTVLALLYKSYRDSVINEIRVYEKEYATRLDEIASIETGTLNNQLMQEMQQIDDSTVPIKQENSTKRTISEVYEDLEGPNKHFKLTTDITMGNTLQPTMMEAEGDAPHSGSSLSSGLSELDEKELDSLKSVVPVASVFTTEPEVGSQVKTELFVETELNATKGSSKGTEMAGADLNKREKVNSALVGDKSVLSAEQIVSEVMAENIEETEAEEQLNNGKADIEPDTNKNEPAIEEKTQPAHSVIKEKPAPATRGRRGRYPRNLHKEDPLVSDGKASSVSRDNSPDSRFLISSTSTPTPNAATGLKPNKRFQNMANPLLANISSNRSASFFTAPVNPNDAPHYYTLIHSPTDLRTIKAMIKDGRLQDSSSLELELCKMFANAIMYNSWDSDVCEWSRQMASETESLLGIFKSAERGRN
ncbi:hypothetical protein NADFUDRAFT_83930 [Nadsonia fulvescens var. elongata DSM 6958]|uniref:Bromo domain-containing protein n=1 Tax=Nadsonia fulvescens var. elongata DSM 6958 TaxID=857566 RepID=A0A1E3PG09_9ASCO|nr:hypothetical protein NADFUDRAFT_83930 [Nadsonia fulvescens var. elongata DSM 6958]